MQGILTPRTRWLYEDTPLGELPQTVSLTVAADGRAGVQFLLPPGAVCLELEGGASGAFEVEFFRMTSVPVAHNSRNVVEQTDRFLQEDHSLPLPEGCTRPAPFRVYDALEPQEWESHSGGLSASLQGTGPLAGYLTFRPVETGAGVIEVFLTFRSGPETQTVVLQVEVFAAKRGAVGLKSTTWFRTDFIASNHGLIPGSEEHLAMVRQYARLMRRMHQTHFSFWLDGSPLEDLTPFVELFFAEGFETLELGTLLCRDSTFTDELRVTVRPDLPVSGPEGLAALTDHVATLAQWLKVHGWERRCAFHVHDEPDVHVATPEALAKRQSQYHRASQVLKAALPEARIIEAVKTTAFAPDIDILVPLTDSLEAGWADFSRWKDQGKEIWTYVCCVPGGLSLNRFLDMDLIRGRLLFWLCAKDRLSGYLHWGLNQFLGGFNPFEVTSCPNTAVPEAGDFPSGDAFLVYPGPQGPWPSLRLEAQRQGIEDHALLSRWAAQDPAACEALVGRLVRHSRDYESDPGVFDSVRRELLERLSVPADAGERGRWNEEADAV